MAPKKKKGTLANPARGFATVSIPSKPRETVQASDSRSPAKATVNEENFQSVNNENPNHAHNLSFSQNEKPIPQMSPDELEKYFADVELQMVIDSHASRIRTEADRYVIRLLNERRHLRQQTHPLSMPSNLLEELCDSPLLSETALAFKTGNALESKTQTSAKIDATALLLNLWQLQLVLHKLRFPGIMEALEHITMLFFNFPTQQDKDNSFLTHTAFEWYALHMDSSKLPDYQTGLIRDHESVETEEGTTFQAEDKLVESSSEAVTPRDNHDMATESEALIPLSDLESDEDDDPASLVDRYLRYRASIFKLEHIVNNTSIKEQLQLTSRRRIINDRIQKIERDPLFDSKPAGELWKQRLRELVIEEAKTNKRGEAETTQSEDGKLRKHSVPSSTTSEPDGVDMLGAIFAGDETGTGATNEKSTNSSIRILDFGSWTGVHPRRLLEDVCKILDGQYKIHSENLSETSHSARSRMRISWSAIRNLDITLISALPEGVQVTSRTTLLTLEMISVATKNSSQSDAFLSTLALFLLAESGGNDQKPFLRLPKTFRELYQDLVSVRNGLINEKYKTDLGTLRELIRQVRSKLEIGNNGHVTKVEESKTIPVLKAQRHKPRLDAPSAKQLWEMKSSSPAFAAMLKYRTQLPVYFYKSEILRSVEQDGLVIICADTGAGKSTQVPSFVLEECLQNGRDCRILVTQPRRISAISLARRVSQELGEPRAHLGTNRSLVGYAIRLESKTSEATRITYATTGVLLRMLESDIDLRGLDYLILDEVHERTMDLDLLFITLSQLQQRRDDLKIILMSATVDAQKFSRYFRNAPVLDIPGRKYPVELYYLEDAVEETQHFGSESEMPADVGEVQGTSGPEDDETNHKSMTDALEGYSNATKLILKSMDEYQIDYALIARLVTAIATTDRFSKYNKAMLIFMPGIGEIRRLQNLLLSLESFRKGWIIHMLHSSFSTEDLERAFIVPPDGHRKIVIATNIAETGITIPDVTTVIDTCKEKIMRFDERRQLSRLTEGFISRSSARQRKGRAARVQEGLCFHLVTRHRYENLMTEQHTPEMLRLSLQDPILRIKIWNMGSIEDTLAAAIDPPTSKNIRRAIEKLKDAGALDATENLTALGQIVARLPLDVAMSKLAVFGVVFQCLDPVLTIIAMLSSKSPFVTNMPGSKIDSRAAFSRGDSDLLSSLNAYSGWKKAGLAGATHLYCKKHNLNDQALMQIEDQKIQLLVNLVDTGLLLFLPIEKAALNTIRSSGSRKSTFDIPERYSRLASDGMICSVVALAFYPRILLREGKGYRNVYTNQQVSLGSSSINRASERPPKWLCFYEAMQMKSGNLNVFETSKIPEAAIVLLMGEADFKLFSGVVVIDHGRIRFSLRHWKQMMALKNLREAVTGVLDRCFRKRNLSPSPEDQAVIDEVAKAVGSDVDRETRQS